MKYGWIVLVLMVSLRLVHGAESLEREEPAHPADATAVAVKDDSLRTYTNNQYFQSPEELRAFFADRIDLEIVVFELRPLRNDFSEVFGGILSQMKHLRRLMLARTQFTPSQLESIVRNLDFSRLESFNLFDTRIGPRGVLVLATYLSRARQFALKELNLNRCLMEDPGMRAVAQIISRLPYLEKLGVMGNDITDRGAEVLLSAVEKTDIQYIEISDNDRISVRMRDKLKATLKERIHW
jgi:hypothetical protein